MIFQTFSIWSVRIYSLNITGLRHRVAKISRFQNQSLWQKLPSQSILELAVISRDTVKTAIPDSQQYHWNLFLIIICHVPFLIIMCHVVVFLGIKLFNFNIPLFFCSRNSKVTFVKKPQINQYCCESDIATFAWRVSWNYAYSPLSPILKYHLYVLKTNKPTQQFRFCLKLFIN